VIIIGKWVTDGGRMYIFTTLILVASFLENLVSKCQKVRPFWGLCDSERWWRCQWQPELY